jgi:NADPH-dependent 2,4-dienoyl-CoA reductase/sulfur reductase-like enzyme
LLLRDSAEEFEKAADGISVRLKSGSRLAAQMVMLGVGVRPENKLAFDAGLAVGPRGSIRVNQQFQPNDPNIYAVGDVIAVTDFVTGGPTHDPLAGPAYRQGGIAADDIIGRDTQYRGTQRTAIVRVLERTAAMPGVSEKVLRWANRTYCGIYIHPANHAGYYPSAGGMTLKLLFDRQSGRVLGAQVAGGAGVDKRIDVLAVPIQARMAVFDLEETELAHLPQYGSAKNPINMAGFFASGLLRGDHPQIDVEELLVPPFNRGQR